MKNYFATFLYELMSNSAMFWNTGRSERGDLNDRPISESAEKKGEFVLPQPLACPRSGIKRTAEYVFVLTLYWPLF